MKLMTNNEVTVVDHGLCNMFNITCALEEAGARVVIARDASEVTQASRLILPGVGAFEPAMRTIREMGFQEAILTHATSGKPLLGICLGMQLLMTDSQENGRHKGLGLIGGSALKFPTSAQNQSACKIPQIAWNTLHNNSTDTLAWNDPLLTGVPECAPVYFVHSYYVVTDAPQDTVAYAEYAGVRYSAVVRRANVWGAQFHPERSAKHGLKMLANFVEQKLP